MKIEIDTATATNRERVALIGALMALCDEESVTLTPAQSVVNAGIEESNIQLMAYEVSARVSELTATQIVQLLADLNAELYSRSTIKPEDNPAAGSGVTTEMIEGADDTMGAGVDLAAVFAQAGEAPAALSADKKVMSVDTVPLDKAGLPWDARIHSASKAQIADGTWRQKRGVDSFLLETVIAELRQAMSVGVPADEREYHNDTAEASEARVKVGIDPAPKLPPPPPRKVAPPPPPAADSGEIDTFPRLLKFITEGKLANKFNQAQVAAALLTIGIEGPLPVLQARPDLIPAMVTKLRVIGG